MKRQRPYKEALACADRLAKLLQPSCERLSIAGSIRRGVPVIGDIELVAIPSPLETDLFGETTRTSVDWWVDSAKANGEIDVIKDGAKYKQFRWRDDDDTLMQVDLFLATPDNWGYILMLRTGPWQFSKRMVTLRTQSIYGHRPPEYQVEGGQVWQGDKAVPVSEEKDLFALWGMDYIEPRDRR